MDHYLHCREHNKHPRTAREKHKRVEIAQYKTNQSHAETAAAARAANPARGGSPKPGHTQRRGRERTGAARPNRQPDRKKLEPTAKQTA
jgi:hypothetical protein